jgi:hypothetical protein
VLGVVAGIVTAIVCVIAIEAVCHMLFPPPPGINLEDPADLARLMDVMPTAALAIVAAGWFVGSLAGAAVANAAARQSNPGWIVALVMIAGAVWTMVTIPHPLWMWAAGLLLPLVAAWLAQRMVMARA